MRRGRIKFDDYVQMAEYRERYVTEIRVFNSFRRKRPNLSSERWTRSYNEKNEISDYVNGPSLSRRICEYIFLYVKIRKYAKIRRDARMMVESSAVKQHVRDSEAFSFIW